MKKILLSLILIFSSSVFAQEAAPTATPPALSAQEIMQKQYDQNKGYHDEKGLGKILIHGAGGDTAAREFEYQSLEDSPTQGSKALLRIVQPANLNGTGLLTYQNKGRDDDQWIYLPALKKTNRIVGGAKKGSFIGSDFSYEDMAPKALADYSYTLVRTEACGAISCYVIDCIPQGKTSIYSKTTAWVRSDNFQNSRIELYDEKGVLVKKSTFDDLRQLNGKFWRPFKITMEDINKKTSSELNVETLSLQNGLKDSDFMTSILER